MSKIHLFLCLFFLINSCVLLAQLHTVFISKFEINLDSLKEDIGEIVALDFEKVFSICTERYSVLKHEHYTSIVKDKFFTRFKRWISPKTDTTNIQKRQLKVSEVDFHLFGSINRDYYKDKHGKDEYRYVIEYMFEDPNTNTIYFMDNIAFNTYEDLLNQKLRHKKIFKRLIEEFTLCEKS